MPIDGGPGLPGEYQPPADWPAPPLPCFIVWDDRVLSLREADAGELLGAVAFGNWTAFLPGLLEDQEDLEWLDGRLVDRDDPLDFAELAVAGQWVAAHVCRMPWWAARRLAAEARINWHLLAGKAALTGADVSAWPVDRVLAAQWALLWSRVEEGEQEHRDDLHRKVWEADMTALDLAALAAPDALASQEAVLAQDLVSTFAGMDGFQMM